MAIIDNLPALTSPTSGDELPIERGTTLYKIDYDALAAAIIAQQALKGVKGNSESSYRTGNVNLTPENIGAAPYTNLVNLTTWAAIYTALAAIPNQGIANVFIAPDTAEKLTGNSVSAVLIGSVSASNKTNGIYDFTCSTANSSYIYIWRITGLSSASSTPTVGTVYTHTSNAANFINLSNLSSWADIYNALSILGTQEMANVFIANAGVLTNNKSTAVMMGIVSASNRANGAYDFYCSGIVSQYTYQWRISGLTSASSTPTVGTVYRFTGSAM